MTKRIFSLILAIMLAVCIVSGCNSNEGENNSDGGKIDSEVTESLKELEGQSIEGHAELIDNKYVDHISNGADLLDQLRGYKLVDFDYGDVTGFKAGAFTKGKSLVIVYCGTDDWHDYYDDLFAEWES